MFTPWGGPGGSWGLKLDEIDAANSFLMLPMARNGFKWPLKTHLRPGKHSFKKYKNLIFFECEKSPFCDTRDSHDIND